MVLPGSPGYRYCTCTCYLWVLPAQHCVYPQRWDNLGHRYSTIFNVQRWTRTVPVNLPYLTCGLQCHWWRISKTGKLLHCNTLPWNDHLLGGTPFLTRLKHNISALACHLRRNKNWGSENFFFGCFFFFFDKDDSKELFAAKFHSCDACENHPAALLPNAINVLAVE